MKNSGIILAGGSGARIKNEIPKQYLLIKNKMIIEYSINQFINNKNINEIIVVCKKGWINQVQEKYPKIKIVCGGENRLESSFLGLQACNNKTDNVLIHDAARPLINQSIINTCIKSLNKYDAAIPTLDCDDSLIDKKTLQYINRNLIKRIQTPQGFRYKIIFNAYNKLMSSKLNEKSFFKDDLSILLKFSNNIKHTLFNGEKLNFKITTKEDINKFEFLLKC